MSASNAAAAPVPTAPQARCLVAAGLQSQLLLPGSEQFAARIGSYWSNNAKLQPACILQPRSAGDVAKAVAALGAAGQAFAVCSGRHTNWAGSNNIAGGVTLDLGLLCSVGFSAAAGTADVGPGATWASVYEGLARHGRTVAGGREPTVGVGGLLLGGGLSYHSGRSGFACDSVVAYEVVLAGGRVVRADAAGAHADLFRVLRGGGNNFGVVTRFTLRTLPRTQIWGGLCMLPPCDPAMGVGVGAGAGAGAGAADAVARFTAGITDNPDGSLIYVLSHNSSLGEDVAVIACVNVAAVDDPPAFAQIRGLAGEHSSFKIMELEDFMAYSPLVPNLWNVWFTLCFRNDASIIQKTTGLHAEMVRRIQHELGDDFTSNCAFHPISRALARHSVAAGGNVLGVDGYRHDGMLLHVCVASGAPGMAEGVRPHVKALVDGVRAFAEGVEDGVLPWLHLNYADPSQAVLDSYGRDNMARMKAASLKYDPEGVFQRLCLGGFKIRFDEDGTGYIGREEE